MGYDLLIADRSGTQIVTVPFYWLARLLAWLSLSEGGYASITRGRTNIIWQSDSGRLPKGENAEGG